MTLDKNALSAALNVKFVGQFWLGETAMESEDTNWLYYKEQRFTQIIETYLAALPTTSVSEPVSDLVKRLRDHEGIGAAMAPSGGTARYVCAIMDEAASALTAAEARAAVAEETLYLVRNERDNLRDQMIDALEQRSLAEGWRPIETAPKDGTYFIGFWPHASRLYADHQGQYRTRWTGWGGGCWEADSLGRPVEMPSHWMPLPQPPEAK